MANFQASQVSTRVTTTVVLLFEFRFSLGRQKLGFSSRGFAS
jgi:hypothetical protein